MLRSYIFGLSPLITSLVVLVFGIISITRKPPKLLYRIFAGFCFTVSTWAFFYSLMYLNDLKYALQLARYGYLAVVFIPAFAFHFTLLFVESDLKFPIFLVYFLSLIFLPVSQTDYFLKGAQSFFWGPYPLAGPLYIYFVIYFMGSFLSSVGLLFYSYKRKSSGAQINQNQTKFLFLAFAIASTSLVDYVPNYGYSVYPFAYISTFFWIALIAYATLRYRLMDFNLILRWGIAYTTSILIVVLIFIGIVITTGSLFGLIGAGKAIPILFCSCLSVFIFDPIKKHTAKAVDALIFKSPDFKVHIDKIQTDLTSPGSLESKTEKISGQLKSIWNVDHAGFVIWSTGEGKFSLHPKAAFNDKIIVRLHADLTQADFLVKTLGTERRLFRYGIVLEEELTALGNRAYPGERITFWKMRRTMRWLGATICIPLMTSHELIGFFLLGPKKNNAIFNEEDKKFLAHVSEKVSEFFKAAVLTQNINTWPKESIT